MYDQWPENYPDFSFNGNTYYRDQTYNLKQFCKDYLQWRMNYLCKMQNYSKWQSEFDSDSYSWPHLNGLAILMDLVDDSTLATQAEMTFDLMLLEGAMQANIRANGTQWGGAHGRDYPVRRIAGKTAFLWDMYWDTNKNGLIAWPAVTYGYVSDYRIPNIIEDITDFSDESTNYWHIHNEKYMSGGYNRGKSTMVAKDWNLGSGPQYWELNVYSSSPESLNP